MEEVRARSQRPSRRPAEQATRRGQDLRRAPRESANTILTDAEYTGRQDLLVGQWWAWIRLVLGLPGAIVAALTSAGAALSALTNGDPSVTAGLALASALITTLKAALRPEERAAGHTSKGGAYITLRNHARDFMTIDLRSSVSTDALEDRQRRLRERLEALRAQEPLGLPPFAYRIVRWQIGRGQYDYKNDPLWDPGD
jgi:hypothetical protein